MSSDFPETTFQLQHLANRAYSKADQYYKRADAMPYRSTDKAEILEEADALRRDANLMMQEYSKRKGIIPQVMKTKRNQENTFKTEVMKGKPSRTIKRIKKRKSTRKPLSQVAKKLSSVRKTRKTRKTRSQAAKKAHKK